MGIRLGLKLNGAPLKVSPEVAIKQFLDKASADDLFSLKQLAKAAKINYKTLCGDPYHELPELRTYTFRKEGCVFNGNVQRIWGNPKAIADVRKGLGL